MIQRDAHVDNAIARAFLAHVGYERREWVNPFSESRWPYTYAFDFVRSHTSQDWGRGEVGGALSDWIGRDTENHDEVKERICRSLALAYCEESGVEVPEEYRRS